MRDKLRDRSSWKGGTDNEHVRAGRNQCDGCEIFKGIVAECFFIKRWGRDEWPVDGVEQCVTIRCCARCQAGTNIAPCPVFVFDDDILVERL